MSGTQAGGASGGSVLVVGPSWVGDMIMAQALLKTLKAGNPAVQIDMLAPGWSLPVIARMPEVRAGVELPLGHGEFRWATRARLGRELRDRAYHQAIVLPRSFKAALVPFHARIPQRTGYRGEMRIGLLNDIRPLDKTVLRQTAQRFVALGVQTDGALPPPIPEPQLRVDHANQERLMADLGLAVDRPIVGFMPGAEYGPAKCWPLEYWEELAARLVGQGMRVWVLGSAREGDAGGRIASAAPRDVENLCGRTQLEDAVDLLALTGAAVTNDSGLMHMAAAVGTRVVAIYGSSTPDFTPPLTERKSVHYLGIECSPCFDRTCRFGHYRCLRDISVERVAADVLASV